MSSKKARREQAIRKKQRNRRVIITACIVALAAFVGFYAIYAFNQRNNRVFAEDDQRVTLFENGNFTAQLPHGVNKSGTYTEEDTDGTITITFVYDGTRSQGNIVDDILILPNEWIGGCGHGHSDRLPQTRGPRQEDSDSGHNHNDEHVDDEYYDYD